MPELTPNQKWHAGYPGFYKLSHPKAVLITHYGVAEVDYYGRTTVFELTPKKYSITDRVGFAGSAKVTVLDWKPLSFAPVVRERVQAVMANYPRFDLLGHNCEHAVNELWEGKHESKQADFCKVLGAILFAFVGIVLAGGARK